MYTSAQEALAIIQDASKTLNISEKRLKPALIELKTLKSPPQLIKTILEILCIILDLKPGSKPDVANPGKFIPDYWAVSRKILADPNSLTENILNLDKFNLSKSKLEVIKSYLSADTDLVYEQVKKVSTAASIVFTWIQGVYWYGTAMTYLGAEHPSLSLKEKEKQQPKKLIKNRMKSGRNKRVTQNDYDVRPKTVPTNFCTRSVRNHTSIGGIYDYYHTSNDLTNALNKNTIPVPAKNRKAPFSRFSRTKTYSSFQNFRY